MIRVSVVIPAHDARDSIGPTLDSVARQTAPPHEVVVVDDGSTDGTARVVRRWIDDHPALDAVLLRQENRGPGAARNRAIDRATGEFVAFLDADDAWEEEKLERVSTFLREEPADVVAHDMILVGDRAQGDVFRAGPHETYWELLTRRNCLVTSGTVARREAVLEVGGFSEEQAMVGVEDYDLWLRLARAGCEFRYLHEPLGRYRQHLGGISKQVGSYLPRHTRLFEVHFRQSDRARLLCWYFLRKRKAHSFRAAARTAAARGERRAALAYAARAVAAYPVSWKNWGVLALAVVRLAAPSRSETAGA